MSIHGFNRVNLFIPISSELGYTIEIFKESKFSARDSNNHMWTLRGVQGELTWWVRSGEGDCPFLGYEIN